MKAVVVELRGKQAAVLDEKGCVTVIPDQNYAVGQVIGLPRRKNSISVLSRRVSAAAAVIAVCFGITSYALPRTSVSLDADSSISYTLNMYDRVIGISAMNQAAGETVSAVRGKVFGKNIGEAVSITLNELKNSDQINPGEEENVVLAVSGNEGHAEHLADSLMQTAASLEAESTPAGGKPMLHVSSVAVTGKLDREAKEKNVTPGKLYSVNCLKAVQDNPDTFDTDAWLNKSINEIQAAASVPSSAESGSETPENEDFRKPPEPAKPALPEETEKKKENTPPPDAPSGQETRAELPAEIQTEGTAAYHQDQPAKNGSASGNAGDEQETRNIPEPEQPGPSEESTADNGTSVSPSAAASTVPGETGSANSPAGGAARTSGDPGSISPQNTAAPSPPPGSGSGKSSSPGTETDNAGSRGDGGNPGNTDSGPQK